METQEGEVDEDEFIEDDDYGEVVPNKEQSVSLSQLSIKFTLKKTSP